MASRLDEAPTQIKPQESIVTDRHDRMSNMAAELLGTTLDHFELLDSIGAGGMGQVFLARDDRLDRLVALKVLSPDGSQDGEVLRRFQQEAKAAARLDNPHFASVYYFGSDKGLCYIAMEYVEGNNLRRLIAHQGRLPVQLAVNIGLQMARGLAHAAEFGVVHRDIKPSNIILTPKGLAKLVDMGLARNYLSASGNSASGELTQSGMTLGTFDYISPEQARDPRVADVRSDIYSLGCTLFHSLTGRPPFPEGTALQKLLQHQGSSVPDPREHLPELAQPIARVIMKMMAKDPRDRYQTPADLIHDFRALSSMFHVTVPEDFTEQTPMVVERGSWDRHLFWAVPTLLLLGAVSVMSFFNSGQSLDLPERLTRQPEPTPSVQGAAVTGVAKDDAGREPSSKTASTERPNAAPNGNGKATTTKVVERPATETMRKGGDGDGPVFPDEPVVVASNTNKLTVNPSVPGGTLKSVFKSIATACDEAESGMTIELESNDVLDAANVLIDGKELTIRPAKGYSPVLRLDPQKDPSASTYQLFVIENRGRLNLEEVDLIAEGFPDSDDYPTVALFEVMGGSRVACQDCALVMGENSRNAQFHVVRNVTAPTRGLNDDTRPNNRVEFDRCNIRSSGGLLDASPEGLWSILVRESFIATAEAAILVEGWSEDWKGPGPKACDVDFSKTSFRLWGSLISVTAFGEQPLPPRQIEVTSNDCIFIGNMDEPFLKSSGNHSPMSQRESIRWSGTSNLIAGFTTLFRSGGTNVGQMETPPTQLSGDDWKRYFELSADSHQIKEYAPFDNWSAMPWEVTVPTEQMLLQAGIVDDGKTPMVVSPSSLPDLPRQLLSSPER
ncbi:serine/threonine protein kinase [Kolteria novifilia]